MNNLNTIQPDAHLFIQRRLSCSIIHDNPPLLVWMWRARESNPGRASPLLKTHTPFPPKWPDRMTAHITGQAYEKNNSPKKPRTDLF